MKKIVIVLLSVLILSACTESKTEIQKDITKTYENVTFVKILESLTNDNNFAHGTVLHYDDQLGSIYLYKQKYYINLNEDLTYIYSNDTNLIQRYTISLDEDFQSNAADIYEFIEKIELIENIEFRKFDYLIYNVIADAILDKNQGYLSYKTSRPNPMAYHPHIVIKNENFDKFSKLNDILIQLEPDLTLLPEIRIGLSSEMPTYIHLYIGSKTFDIRESRNENLTNRIILISSLV